MYTKITNNVKRCDTLIVPIHKLTNDPFRKKDVFILVYIWLLFVLPTIPITTPICSEVVPRRAVLCKNILPVPLVQTMSERVQAAALKPENISDTIPAS